MGMDLKKIQSICETYKGILHRFTVNPVRHEDAQDFTPEAYEHMLFMAQTTIEMAESGSAQVSIRDKIMRWFAWLQAKMHTHHLRTLPECKADNAPAGTIVTPEGGLPNISSMEKPA